MNLIEQHMENVARELAQLEDRMAQLKSEQDETRKLLANIRRYRKSLVKQYPSSQATLPLAPPDDEEEEEDPSDPSPEEQEAAGNEPLIPGEWNPDYEVPEEPSSNSLTPEQNSAACEKGLSPSEYLESIGNKPIRRRKAKATAEE
jgi:chromosome segregation ATPase